VQITECWDIIVVTSLVPLDSAMLFIHQISLWLVVHSYIVFLPCRDPSEPYTRGVERERETEQSGTLGRYTQWSKCNLPR
jgi:hypothetical protein